MGELHDAVDLLNDAPAAYRERALKAVMEIAEEYEDWNSLGRPDSLTFTLMQFLRTAQPHQEKLAAAARDYLEVKRDLENRTQRSSGKT